MQHYQIDVDLESIMSGEFDKHIKKIDRAITRGSKNGIIKCEEAILKKLTERMVMYGLGDSLLSGTVNSKKTDVSLSIRMGSEYFMYVEYGTGVVGRDSQHPDTSRVGWRYDTNAHGEMGWWYPSSIDDPNPTKYRNDNGWWAWTKGQRARPFMYETWMWAMENCTKIISEEIGKEVEKVKGVS